MKYEIISSLLTCLYNGNKNEDLKRIKIGAQTKPNDCLLFVIFYYFCAVKEYATLQVASPRLRFIIIDTAKAGAINLRHFP